MAGPPPRPRLAVPTAGDRSTTGLGGARRPSGEGLGNAIALGHVRYLSSMADDLPAELIEAFKILDPAQADRLKEALAPVAGELGPRERAVLERLVKGMASGVPASDLNAFVRLLPVTVSRAIQPAIPTAKA
jgi:hypothetical protein